MAQDPNNHLYVSGRKVGIEFAMKRNIYPTQKAHALIEYLKDTKGNDAANQMMEEMFQRYFEKSENINDDVVLAEIATKFGVDNARSVIDDDSRLMAVNEKDFVHKRKMGVSGVPFFIIENNGGRRVAFSGAQPIDLIAEQLKEAVGEF